MSKAEIANILEQMDLPDGIKFFRVDNNIVYDVRGSANHKYAAYFESSKNGLYYRQFIPFDILTEENIIAQVNKSLTNFIEELGKV